MFSIENGCDNRIDLLGTINKLPRFFVEKGLQTYLRRHRFKRRCNVKYSHIIGQHPRKVSHLIVDKSFGINQNVVGEHIKRHGKGDAMKSNDEQQYRAETLRYEQLQSKEFFIE